MMDDAAFEALKPGQIVEAKIGGRWVRARFVQWPDGKHPHWWGYFRRLGVGIKDRRYPLVPKGIGEVRPTLEPVTANVFADWLEDHGEPRAAEKLRQRFPVVNAEGETP